MDYKIITTPRIDRMEQEVIKHLNDGWELNGNLFIAQSGAMAQAMTKIGKPAARPAPKKAAEEPKKAKGVPYGGKVSE